MLLTGLCSRLPHGGRGLKFQRSQAVSCSQWSSPARGTWVEIRSVLSIMFLTYGSSPARGTWVEMSRPKTIARPVTTSSPARGTWVEIYVIVGQQLYAIQSSPARGTWVEIQTAVRVLVSILVVSRTGDVG